MVNGNDNHTKSHGNSEPCTAIVTYLLLNDHAEDRKLHCADDLEISPQLYSTFAFGIQDNIENKNDKADLFDSRNYFSLSSVMH